MEKLHRERTSFQVSIQRRANFGTDFCITSVNLTDKAVKSELCERSQSIFNHTNIIPHKERRRNEKMKIWKNGRKPPFMDSKEKDLNAEKIYFAVKQMTLEGLQDMAIYGLMLLAKFKSPAEICGDIEGLQSKKEVL